MYRSCRELWWTGGEVLPGNFKTAAENKLAQQPIMLKTCAKRVCLAIISVLCLVWGYEVFESYA